METPNSILAPGIKLLCDLFQPRCQLDSDRSQTRLRSRRVHAEDVAGAFDLTPFSLEHMTISTKMSEHYNYGTRIHLDERNDGLVHEGFKHTELETDTQQTARNQRRVFLVDVLARRLARRPVSVCSTTGQGAH